MGEDMLHKCVEWISEYKSDGLMLRTQRRSWEDTGPSKPITLLHWALYTHKLCDSSPLSYKVIEFLWKTRKLMLKGHKQLTPILRAILNLHGVIPILPIPRFHPRQGVTEPIRNEILLFGSLSDQLHHRPSKRFSEKSVITSEQSRVWLTLGSFLSNALSILLT